MKRLCSSIAFCLAFSPMSALATTIGVSMWNDVDAFQTALHKSISAQGEKKGVTLKFTDAKNQADRQVQQVKELVAAKVDTLIVSLLDGDLAPEISKLAADAGLPLVYLNAMPSNIDELPPKQTYVASDETESGTLQTREACRRMGGRGVAVVLMGPLTSAAARTRTNDINAVLAGDDCKGITIVERQSANWSRAQAEKQMNEWLAAGVRFDALIANNDEMALGAIRAMKTAGLPMKAVVTSGIDGTADAFASMAIGDLDFTVLQNATAQGAASVDAAVTLASDGSLPSKNYVPFELVTLDNLARYAAKN